MKIITEMPTIVDLPASLVPPAGAKPADFYKALLDDTAAVATLKNIAADVDAGATIYAPTLPKSAHMPLSNAILAAKKLPDPEIRYDEAIELPNNYTAIAEEAGGIGLYYRNVGKIFHTETLPQAAAIANTVKQPRFVKGEKKDELKPLPATVTAMQAAMQAAMQTALRPM